MNIDELTYKEIKEITNLFGGGHTSSLLGNSIGKYVIVRSRNEGVNAGIVVKADDTGVVLKEARRLWYSKPLNSSESWYEGVSQVGLHAESKVSSIVSGEKYIVESYSLSICTTVAENSIRGFKANES